MTSDQGPDRYRGYVPALTCVARPFKASDRPWVASGLLIEANSNLCFVTAGHALAELKRSAAANACTNVRLADGYFATSIPIDMAQVRCFIDDDVTGMDFGFMFLNPNQVANLRANPNFRSFSPDAIIGVDALRARFGALGEIKIVGYPRKWAKYSLPSQGPDGVRVQTSFRAVEIPVGEFGTGNLFDEYVDRAPLGYFEREGLFAHISMDAGSPDDVLDDLEGVSGGPVLEDDNGKLSVIGIQVDWLPALKIVRFIPIADVQLSIKRP